MVVVDGETVSLEELIKQMTEIENLTVAMGSVLEKFIHTELEQRRKRQQQCLKRQQQQQQQQQQQRDYRLSYVQLVYTILKFLVVHLG